MTSISVIIGTYGDRAVWGPQAERALSSVENQSRPPLEAKIVHLDSLHEARNSGAESASGEWLCFLDADDLLAPDYLASMTQSITENAVLYPAITYEGPGGEEVGPLLHWSESLFNSNFMVIGTLVRKQVFMRVGGFRDYEMYEDWDLWMRCCVAGEIPMPVPSALYRASKNNGGRNPPVGQTVQAVYCAIRNSYTPLEKEHLQQFCARPAGGLFPRRLSPEDFPWLD